MHIPERLLLGPGPSMIAPRVMRAMAAPVLSHLDPDLMTIMDDVRARLARLFQAPDGALTIAMSGTGSSGMEGSCRPNPSACGRSTPCGCRPRWTKRRCAAGC